MKTAEFAQRHVILADQAIAFVEDLQLVLLAILDGVRVTGGDADHAADVHHLTRAVGGTVGVDVTLVRETLGDADALQVDHV